MRSIALNATIPTRALARLLAVAVAVAVAAAPGCGASMVSDGDAAGAVDASRHVTPPADAGAAVDAGAPARLLAYYDGTYVVPPRAPESTYPTQEVHWIVEGSEVILAYNLPRMITGNSVRVALHGTLSPDRTRATLSGAAGTATCEVRPADGALVRCDERFVGVTADLDRVRREAQRDDPGNVDARIEVSERFISDPIGVLEITNERPLPPGTRVCRGDAECDPGMACAIETASPIGLCEAR